MLDNKAIYLINKELADFSFPDFTKIRVNNNLEVFFIEDKTQPLISFKLFVNKGAFDELKNGLYYISMQMLKRGTRNRNSFEIADEIEQMGVEMSFGANWHSSLMSLITLPDFFDKSLEILFDCFFNPSFDNNELNKFKVIHLADIEQEMADPSYISNLIFNKNMYGNYPYAKPIIGDKKSVELINRDDCINIHKNLISQHKYFIIIAGNISKETLQILIEKYFTSFLGKNGNTIKQNIEHIQFDEKRSNRIVIKNIADANQTVFKIGKNTIGRDNKDYPALKLANTILGGYFNSRLNKILREELGYTYGVHSLINTKLYASAFEIKTSVKKETSRDTVSKILEELNKLSDKPIPEEEFFTAKQYFLGSFIRSMETPQQISAMIYSLITNNLEYDYYDVFYKKISQINIDDLFKVQKKYFKPEDLLITAIGDEKLLHKSLKDFGKIQI